MHFCCRIICRSEKIVVFLQREKLKTMNDEELNNQLYESLCASVLKWFETVRGDEDVKIEVNKDSISKDYSFPEAVIGDTIRDASFSVGIVKEPIVEGGPFRCWMGIGLDFRDKIHAIGDDEKEYRGDMLNIVNQFNMWNREMCCVYDERFDTIEIRQSFHFYPGSHPTNDDISKLLNEFYFNKDIEGITELIEAGGWCAPELYVKDLFVRKVNLVQ